MNEKVGLLNHQDSNELKYGTNNHPPTEHNSRLTTSSGLLKMNNENGDMYYSMVGHEEEVGDVLNGQFESASGQTSKSSTTNGRKVQIAIERQMLNQQDVEEKFSTGEIYKPQLVRKVARNMMKSCACSMFCLVSFFQRRLPILQWLPNYPLQKYLLSDLITAFTVLILHIPQGMAYGLLAAVDPINGLYTSFFPVIVYCIMGTSQHISIGTMAVISLMAGNAAESLVADNKQNGPLSALGETARNLSFNGSENLFYSADQSWSPTNLEVVVSLCFVTGFFRYD
ncbi:solute carrier family 26 member 6-like isoform X1 [Tachypleus tridentatus]|uniref:solute carrier family 26 member 6-like isoform X1 n=2 Tax=Tachypleus tridentatus TaxID=6853 RepID=UPI003FD04854